VRSLLAVVALAAFCGAASAAILVVNCGTVSGPAELAAASVLCPQFNLAGQTVSSISINISGGITGSLTLTNGTATTQTATETTSSQFSAGALTGFGFVNPVFPASYTSGNRTLNAGQTLTISGLSGNGNGSLGTNTTTFGPYIGPGNFTIPVSTATDVANV